MTFPPNPALRDQLPLVARIIREEIARESERRGQTVPADDPVARANACAAILRRMSPPRTCGLDRITAEVMAATHSRSFTTHHAA